MDLLDRLLPQLTALKSVWGPFLIAAVIVGVLVYKFLDHQFRNRLDSKDSLLTLKDAQLADYMAKLSGATPDEARARIDALEERVARISPRRLKPDQRATLVKQLTGLDASINIVSDAAANVSGFVKDLQEAFSAAGWQVNRGGMVVGIANPPPSGLHLAFTQENQKFGERVEQAFRTAGIGFAVGGPTISRGEMSLLVTNPYED